MQQRHGNPVQLIISPHDDFISIRGHWSICISYSYQLLMIFMYFICIRTMPILAYHSSWSCDTSTGNERPCELAIVFILNGSQWWLCSKMYKVLLLSHTICLNKSKHKEKIISATVRYRVSSMKTKSSFGSTFAAVRYCQTSNVGAP